MYHSITFRDVNTDFGEFNTYDSWKMIPTSRPVVKMPELKTYTVDLPGIDNVVDYTELLLGRPAYGRRKGSWEFYLRPGYGWLNVYNSIAAVMHGFQHKVILEDDKDYFYQGRITINEWRSEQNNSTLVLDYDLDPFRYSTWSSGDLDWDFNTVIEENSNIYYGAFTVDGTMSRNLKYDKSAFPAMMEIVTTEPMLMEYNGLMRQLVPGLNKNAAVYVSGSDNVVTFYGHGLVQITYREMRL